MQKFKRKEELYNLSWAKKPRTKKIGEVDVPLPVMPPEKEMVNYEKKTKDQKFVRRPLPENILMWQKIERDEYVEAEWHRRLNGYWILIKGQPMYIPGACDVHCNYWTMETGGTPDFKIAVLDFFQFWQMVENDDECFGMICYKPRRATFTENALSAVWERSTRYKNFPAGMQHVNEKDVLKNYARVVKGNNGMPFFFRPINKGSTNPKDGLIFEIPDERITKKRLEEGEGAMIELERGLGSRITYEASVTGAYDGSFLGTYYLDEVFKIKQFRLNVADQWNIIRPCLSYHNNQTIIGKAIMTSTVEEVEDGVTLELAQKFWDDSDIKKKSGNGRTLSGLYRWFTSFEKAADTDEWGFHKEEDARKKREADIKFYKENKRFDMLLSLYRKQPANIEEALSSPPTDCILHPELCEARLHQIKNGIDRYGREKDKNGKPIARKDVYGELTWKDGIFGGTVEWTPSKDGKWCISQLPTTPNAKQFIKNLYYPANHRIYRMGADPYDSATLQGEGSDGAFCIKRLFDPYAEKDIEVDERGNITNPEMMVTDQYVCDYKYRHSDPYKFYEDIYKTMCFYGCLCFPERDKPGFITWMIKEGLGHWIQDKPKQLWTSRQRKGEMGAKATEEIISQYVDLLKSYIPRRIWCCHHPRLIKDWKFFTVKRRTKFDLAVSSGFTELASVNDYQVREEEKENVWKSDIYNFVDN